MNKHIRYLNLARNVSELSDYDQHHIGCVLEYKKHVISSGYNIVKSHPLQAEYNKYRPMRGPNVAHKLHAEIMCLHKANKLFDIDFSDCTLYIFRALKNGEWAMARACPSCLAMIKDLGIKRIVYTTNYGYAIEHIER
ncbi:MAG TPA: hypothetical protein DC057_03390 [Spirochaetia bacterium]|nr:hypothetical protein [Spirochaetia bacterium]